MSFLLTQRSRKSKMSQICEELRVLEQRKKCMVMSRRMDSVKHLVDEENL